MHPLHGPLTTKAAAGQRTGGGVDAAAALSRDDDEEATLLRAGAAGGTAAEADGPPEIERGDDAAAEEVVGRYGSASAAYSRVVHAAARSPVETTSAYLSSSDACRGDGETSENGTDGDDEQRQREKRRQRRRRRRRFSKSELMYDELRGMADLAAPVVGTYLLEILPGVTSLILVGNARAGPKTAEFLDAAALSVAYANLLGLAPGLGLATAMDTLCSQAFGADETRKMGLYLQSGAIVLMLTFVVVAVLFWRATDILLALGQPAEIAELAGTFTAYLLPGIPFLFVYELLRKVLQAQNVASPMFVVALLANVLNVIVGYYLVYCTDCSWLGAAVARTVSNMSFALFLLPYLAWSGLAQTFWDGWNLRAALREVPQFLSLGLPGMLQVCLEWWAFEVLIVVCGLLPDAVTAIGSNAIIINVSSLTYTLFLGVAVAGNVRIGNALGAGEPRRAATAARLTMGASALTSLLCSVVLVVFREQIPALFTHDEAIIDLATVLVGVCALYQVPDGVTSSIMGIFRGIGRQSLGAWLNLAAYYGVGIPLGCALAFGWHLGVEGLWLGMTTGLFLISVGGTYIISCCDWASLAEEAMDRVNGSEFA